MQTQTSVSYTVSSELLAREDFRAACRARDFAEAFRLMRKYDGASQDRIASPVEGLTQSRVSRIMRGDDRIAGVDVIERVADALRIPGGYFGLAARPWEADESAVQIDLTRAEATDRSADATTPTPPKVTPASGPVDEVRESRLSVDIDIADGAARLTYEHHVENVSSAPFTRFTRALWFAVADGPLSVEPTEASDRNVIIQRIHQGPAHLTYGCQMFPAVQPGESATVGYTCTGGVFRDEHYWRQDIVCPVRELSIRVTLHGVPRLTACSAVEERADGSEVSATESLSWQREGDSLVIELTRHDLRPHQFVTLRWDFPRATA